MHKQIQNYTQTTSKVGFGAAELVKIFKVGYWYIVKKVFCVSADVKAP